jgi:CRISPR/Cas system CSM-associated protein Csm3 (group 7 of RAMP superfamily)
MANVAINFSVTLESTLHIGTGEGFAGIIDRRTLTRNDEENRYPVILGHTIKGMLKDEYQRLLKITGNGKESIDILFGTKQQQGKLYFTHLELTEDFKNKIKGKTNLLYEVKTGNQIVRGRRVAKSEHLFSHEVVQNNLVFEGDISAKLDDAEVLNGIPESIYYLLFSLYSLKRIGGRKRTGLGKLNVKIYSVKVDGETYHENRINRLLENNINKLVKKEVIANGKD